MEDSYNPLYECGDLMSRMTIAPKLALILGNYDNKHYNILHLEDGHISPYNHQLFDKLYYRVA